MDYKLANDYEIVYLVRENDEESRNAILKKYLPIINKIASNYYDIVSGKGVEYEDLVQEGLIALNDAIDRYQENNGAIFYTFATLCINRHLSTYCQRLNNNKNYCLNNSISEEYAFNVADDFKMDNVFDDMIIKEYLNLFTLEESSVLELRYNGFSYKEISKLLDISFNTINDRLHKIRRIIKNRLC